MKSSQSLTLCAALAALSPAAHAQFDGGGLAGAVPRPAPAAPPPTAWAKFALNPRVRVNLDFRNASIDAVLHMLSQASGVAIIKDPALTGGITLQSPKPQSLDDAFAILNAVLNLKNYELTSEGNFLLVASPPAGRAAQRGWVRRLWRRVPAAHSAGAADLRAALRGRDGAGPRDQRRLRARRPAAQTKRPPRRPGGTRRAANGGGNAGGFGGGGFGGRRGGAGRRERRPDGTPAPSRPRRTPTATR